MSNTGIVYLKKQELFKRTTTKLDSKNSQISEVSFHCWFDNEFQVSRTGESVYGHFQQTSHYNAVAENLAKKKISFFSCDFKERVLAVKHIDQLNLLCLGSWDKCLVVVNLHSRKNLLKLKTPDIDWVNSIGYSHHFLVLGGTIGKCLIIDLRHRNTFLVNFQAFNISLVRIWSTAVFSLNLGESLQIICSGWKHGTVVSLQLHRHTDYQLRVQSWTEQGWSISQELKSTKLWEV